MAENNKQGIPYFKTIIEKIKEVKAFSDISNLKKDLEKYDNVCRRNNKYSNQEISPILILFTVTLNFLNHQKDDSTFKANLKTIVAYDLSKVKLTKEDELSLSGSKSNLNTLNPNSTPATSLEIETGKIKSDSDNSLLISLINNINNEKDIIELKSMFEENLKKLENQLKESHNNIEHLEKILEKLTNTIEELENQLKECQENNKGGSNEKTQELQKQLTELKKDKAEIQIKLNETTPEIERLKEDVRIVLTIKVNYSELIKRARKWWHWPLKFFTCGMWESKEIRKINEDYIFGKFHKKLIIEKRKDLLNIYNNITDLSYKINELKDKTNELLNHNDNFLSSSVNNFDYNSSSSLIPKSKSLSASNISLC